MFKLLFSFILTFSFLYVNGQSTYYWAGEEVLSLTKNNHKYIVHVNEAKSLNDIDFTKYEQDFESLEVFPHKSYLVLTAKENNLQKNTLLSRLNLKSNEVTSVSNGLDLEDGFTLYPTRKIVFKAKDKKDIKALERMARKFDMINIEEKYGVYRVTLDDSNNCLDLANFMNETGLVDFAHPDFYAPIEHNNDPLFSQQFQMNNTGQTLDGVTGVADMDCNALEAWGITLGSSNVTVAVIDDGMEDHEDFNDSSGNSRYTNGFTPANNGNGDAISGSAHGVSCAGSIAASHNGIGVQGVAPLVNMISVNIFFGGESTQDIADGITWAKNNGADVMSNSWGYTSCTANFSNINNAIADAVNNGRGGLGSVIVFASGNGYKSCVDFPANNSNVIAVGAFTNQGVRSSYSNYGSDLDIVAPSNAVSPQPGAGVRTTDRMGSAGYSSGNYTSNFGGTSSACPVVSGVVALMLGYDATLTDAQVKSVLYSTAIDMGAPGNDSEYANGRVNALGAIQALSGGGGPTCSDGVQNGNETGVDCGGPDCPPCNTGCSDTEVTLTIVLDNYPEETSWTLTNSSNSVVASGGTYGSQPDGSTVTENICLPDDCYTFTINDSYGDGICCAYGNGSYSLTEGSNTLASGGAFGSSESTPFCIGAPAPTCDDGIQNGNETGIDCGGPDCPPCGGGSNEVFGSYFETGWDSWSDGGSDCARYSGSRSYEGNYSIRIRDNSGTASSMTSAAYDISAYGSVDLQFYFYAWSMENGEDFFVRYNDGNGWQTVAAYARGTSFNNNTFYTATITLDAANYNLSSNARFRFQCDASGNSDHIYIDQVTLTGNAGSTNLKEKPTVGELIALGTMDDPNIDLMDDVLVSPNPTADIVNLTTDTDITKVAVFGIDGRLYQNILGDDINQIDISELNSGIYMLRIETDEEIYTKRVVKR